MNARDWNEEVRSLANGERPFEQALEVLRPEVAEAVQYAVLLARLADAAQAEKLVAALQEADEVAPAIQYGVGCELVARGLWQPVAAHGWIGTLIVEFMVVAKLAQLPDRADFFAKAAPRLQAALDDPDTNPLSILGVKHFVDELDEDMVQEMLDWLVQEVTAEKAEGFYDDLLYEHGQVDPMVELARCLVVAGRVDDGVEFLQARHAEAPHALNLPELHDLAVIHSRLSDSQREVWGERFAGWASATTTPEGASLADDWMRLRSETAL